MPIRFPAHLLALLLICLWPRFGAAAQTDFSRVGYRDIPGVTLKEKEAVERLLGERTSFIYGTEPGIGCYYQSDGRLGGYAVLLCDWLSALFGVGFTPSLYDRNQLLHNLASYEVDFTDALSSTPERIQASLSTSPLWERPMRRMRLADGPSLAETAASRPLRYAFPIGTNTFEMVGSYLQKPFHAVYVDSHDAAYRMLKDKVVDAFVDKDSYFDADSDVLTEDLLPFVFVPFSLATLNPELAPLISIVQKALDNGALDYLTTLYNKGNENYTRNKFLSRLSFEEKEYVHRHSVYGMNQPVRIGIEYDNYPIAFYNEQEEAWQGCALDVLAAIKKISGLNFVPAHQEPILWPEMLDMLESGKLSIMTELIKTPEREGKFLWPEKPFMEDYFVLISRNDYPNIALFDVRNLRIGLIQDGASTYLFRKWFPDHRSTKEYIDTWQLFSALERDEVDLVMSTKNHLLSMTHYMEKPYFKINIAFKQKYESFFALNKSETILCSILSKALHLVRVDDIAAQWKRRVFDYRGAVARARMPYLLTGLTLFLGIVGLLSVMFVRSRRLGRELEAAVEQRTGELRLQTAAAERAAQAKSAFLARASHEIRTPMNAINGLSELALREYGSPGTLPYIRGIRDAGVALLAVINDILDFSKIESGNLPIHPVPYETASLLNDVLTVVRGGTAKAGLELRLDISPDLPRTMIGDAGRIRQILLNLLSNAVKYTKEGFVGLSVFCGPAGEEEDTVRLTFTVEDSGIGIRRKDMPKLFGEFTRIDEKRNIGIEGTGLGLAIARSLCRAMGGDLTARSGYGTGSVFTAVLVQTAADRTPVGDVTGRTDERTGARRASFIAPEAEVLIVDDLPGNLLVARGLLNPYRVRVSVCANGREAVELVRRHPFDLVLMDHMMPVMDGVAATRALRAMDGERFRTLPVVALTAGDVTGMREMFLENGFNDVLAKPIEMGKLDAVLRHRLPAGKLRKAPPDEAFETAGGNASGEPYPAQASPDRSGQGEERAPFAAPPVSPLPTIAGVDADLGLARIGGSHSLYLRLLAVFRTDAEACLTRIAGDPDGTSLPAFTTQVHAVKSALSNIGADGLSREAAMLEKAGKEADLSLILETLPAFRKELAALAARIGAALAPHAPEAPKTSNAPEAAGTADDAEGLDPAVAGDLETLRDALEAVDIRATDAVLARLQALPLPAALRGAVDEAAEYVLTADFHKATKTVADLLGRRHL
ncbi:MAG: transporter substrate-binding domain-containing protein [Desulfovibrio sp.]|jgi:signal transduction histidine kinase/DNA-binding NarL/FixJ family response regulator/HPt (histidine-containing phosphotransfer) domain-containing protein|nr:transporter substrate-binding domain-containing protein [Desulfovibrio sp.]